MDLMDNNLDFKESIVPTNNWVSNKEKDNNGQVKESININGRDKIGRNLKEVNNNNINNNSLNIKISINGHKNSKDINNNNNNNLEMKNNNKVNLNSPNGLKKAKAINNYNNRMEIKLKAYYFLKIAFSINLKMLFH